MIRLLADELGPGLSGRFETEELRERIEAELASVPRSS